MYFMFECEYVIYGKNQQFVQVPEEILSEFSRVSFYSSQGQSTVTQMWIDIFL